MRPSRSDPIDPQLRPGQHRRVPLGRGQTTPRRRLRLRRRLPSRQPLGREPIPPGPSTRPPPPPRRAYPRPRLAHHHLEMLDHQHPLRPPTTPHPTSPHQPRTQTRPNPLTHRALPPPPGSLWVTAARWPDLGTQRVTALLTTPKSSPPVSASYVPRSSSSAAARCATPYAACAIAVPTLIRRTPTAASSAT